MNIKYAITHIDEKGLRRLTFANQGRNHYDTAAIAEANLKVFKSNNNLESILKYPETLDVRAVECYDHGDAKGIYVDLNQTDLTFLYKNNQEMYNNLRTFLNNELF